MFKVTRREHELVVPAKFTPNEHKLLSDIDDQKGLRFQIPAATMITHLREARTRLREALAQTLVFYYPFAGRLREGPQGKLIVDCSGEDVMFIEVDADVTLQQFGDAFQPPFPCLKELLYDVPGSEGVLNSPLLLIQHLSSITESESKSNDNSGAFGDKIKV
ncbi:LOW QUALITY PROTEIN: hypothetical protein RJ639_035437 [Escallonia herrerae]|uniref:Uncharacterized protein n=1 Tax=Escallonia herrerae TaxID=1293975 RepID=A0AA88WNZ7_9ASTE|nr:LOW QUALITY PROTEIN: hypothetical protein RJ639_035437 [Escallonia herrerae]